MQEIQEGIYYCPICKCRVLGESSGPAQPETLYCPSCEMLVAPVFGPAPASSAHDHGGRSRTGGSNAGGSQRGDLSDQGASQWRRDPTEGERNTWNDRN
jgi:hypothetical protein